MAMMTMDAHIESVARTNVTGSQCELRAVIHCLERRSPESSTAAIDHIRAALVELDEARVALGGERA